MVGRKAEAGVVVCTCTHGKWPGSKGEVPKNLGGMWEEV